MYKIKVWICLSISDKIKKVIKSIKLIKILSWKIKKNKPPNKIRLIKYSTLNIRNIIYINKIEI